MKIFPEDPMMQAVTIYAIMILSVGFLLGFGIGVSLLVLL